MTVTVPYVSQTTPKCSRLFGQDSGMLSFCWSPLASLTCLSSAGGLVGAGGLVRAGKTGASLYGLSFSNKAENEASVVGSEDN